ncbi:right-handed parallel beta-helix repeat-containing protein [Domibacillus mangrovi]|uniref:Periplasmic copper-binding protein NosD beta helix domain-containing protein n=1 Tax=Domibacillus mangrovi TaxID=1714354 RepID=A0A1Q5P3W7_9BACI|nr:NosD domain-containing protein [Domibacillus mangrovi]OKL36926.1 hypothetical protein BLL40_09445 [Domibacillus mangrovi]
MKRFLYLSCFLLFLGFGQTAFASNDLQSLIDESPAGATIYLENKSYDGPIMITKPITLIGKEKTSIQSESIGVQVVEAANVHLQSLQFDVLKTAIELKNVKKSTITNVAIDNSNEGIRMFNAENIHVNGIMIKGKSGHFATKKNGIGVYDSRDIEITGTNIENVQDGLYIENTMDIFAQKNIIKSGRYGIHLMYSDDITLTENEISKNVTGLMVMMVDGITITHNQIQKQNELNSNGLFLYDVKNATVAKNELAENTVASILQNVQISKITNNLFCINGTAIQATKASEVVVTNNTFMGNILTARSDSTGFHLTGNSYDDYDGKDYDGDGIGDTPYTAVKSFGQWMVRKPVYQYFIESPSVVMLNLMDQQGNNSAPVVLVDTKPKLFQSSIKLKFKLHVPQLILGLICLIFIVVVGRKLS